MAQYSGIDTFPFSFETLTDGSQRDAASVNIGLEALGNRTAWLKNRSINIVDGDTINNTLITFTGPLTFNGQTDFRNLRIIDGVGGGKLTMTNGTVLDVNSSSLNVNSSSIIQFFANSTCTFNANSILNISATTTLQNGQKLNLSSRSRSRTINHEFNNIKDDIWKYSTALSVANNGIIGGWSYKALSDEADNELGCTLNLPHNSVLTNVSAYVRGASGHLSDEPAVINRPSLLVTRTNIQTGEQLLLGGAATVDSTSGGSYMTLHLISRPISNNNIVDNTIYKYIVSLKPEQGSKRLDFLVAGLVVNVTLTEMDDYCA